MDIFAPVTTQGSAINALFVLELVISAVLLAIVVGWLVLVLLRFRSQGDTGQPDPPQIHGNRRLEVVWTAVPAAILLAVFVLVVQTMQTVNAAPPAALPLRIVGHQWWWEYEYPTRQVITANELHVPVGTPLQVTVESADVIHSFFVPQFGYMRDAVPGRQNQMSFLVQSPGEYDGTCNQYCGLQHAWMRVIAFADAPVQFDAWVEQQQRPAAPGNSRGEELFRTNTCINCHTIRGVAEARVGPDLTHVGSRTTLGTGVVPMSLENLRRWVRNAGALKPGVLMPAFSNLSEDDLTALAVYLDGLK